MNDCASVNSVSGFRPVNTPAWSSTTRSNKPSQVSSAASKNSLITFADTKPLDRCSVIKVRGGDATGPGDGVGRRDQFMPFTFPTTRTALWDHQETGPSTSIHFIHDRCPLIVLEEKTLRLIQCFTRDALASKDECVCLLSASVCSESDGSSISVKIDRLATNGQSSQPRDLCPGDIQIVCRVSKDGLKSTDNATDYLHSLELISSRCRDSSSIDVSRFLSLRADCSYRSNASSHGVIFQVDFDLVAPATVFRMTPIGPLALVPTALSKNLSGPLSISEIQGEPKSGYITMDQTRKILLVLESDPKVKSLPIVGIWTCGIANVNDAFVWACCARYVYSTHITEKVCFPPDPFLVVIFSPLHSEPEFYESTVINQGGRGGVGESHNPLDFSLSSCHDVIHLNQDNVSRIDSPIEMDLLPVTSGGAKLDAFHSALGEFRGRVRETDSKGSVGGTEEIVPRSFPVPHCSAMSGIQPSVPEVSLLFDGQNGYTSNTSTPVSCGPNYSSPSTTNGGNIPYRHPAVNNQSPHGYNTGYPGAQYNDGVTGSQNLTNGSATYSPNASANNYLQGNVRTNAGVTYNQNADYNNGLYSQPAVRMQVYSSALQQNQRYTAPCADDNGVPRPPTLMNMYRPPFNGYNKAQLLPTGHQQHVANSQMTNGANHQTSAPAQRFTQAQNAQRYSVNGDAYPGGVLRSHQNQIQMTNTRQQTFENQYQNGGSHPAGPRHTSTIPQTQMFSPESQDSRWSNTPSNVSQGYALQQRNGRLTNPPTNGASTFGYRNVGPGQMCPASGQFATQSGGARPPPQTTRQILDNGVTKNSNNQNFGPAAGQSTGTTNQNQNWGYGAMQSQRGTTSPANQMPPPRQAFAKTTQSPQGQFVAQNLPVQSPQNQFVFQQNNGSPVFPRAPSSVSPARHQFSSPTPGAYSVQSPLAVAAPGSGHVSESTDSGFQNDSTNCVDGSGQGQIPQDVYRRLSMQDAELKSLRLQLQELMTRQTGDQGKDERRVNISEVTDDESTKVKGRDDPVRSANAAERVESCSIAINTSLYWPPTSNDASPVLHADRTPVSRCVESNRASPAVISSNNNSSNRFGVSKPGEKKSFNQLRRSDGSVSEERESSLSGSETRARRSVDECGRGQTRNIKTGTGRSGNGHLTNRSVDGCGSCGGADSASLTEIQVTDDVGGDRSGAESNASEMIMDMPGYNSLSPNRIEEGNDDMASDRSPMLGESVSMYEEGYVAKMPCYEEECEGAVHQTIQSDDEEDDEDDVQDEMSNDIQPAAHVQLNYKDMITNINKLLNNQDGSNQQDSSDTSNFVTPKLKSHEDRDRILKNRRRTIDSPLTSFASEEREEEEEPSLIACDIVERTKDQLRRMGVNMDGLERAEKTSTERFTEDTSYYLDPSMLPKVNYVSMMLDQSDADLSYDADALAMKYLRDDQLTELARTRQRTLQPSHRYDERKDAGLDRVVSGGNNRGRRSDVSVYGLPVGNMSYASRQYLVKFGLLDGGGEGSGGGGDGMRSRRSVGDKARNDRRRDQFESDYDDGTQDYNGQSPIAQTYERTSQRVDSPCFSDTLCDRDSPRTTLRHCHSDGDSFQSSLPGNDERDVDNRIVGHNKRRSAEVPQIASSSNRRPLPPRHSLEGFSSTPNHRRHHAGVPHGNAAALARFAHSDGSVPVTPAFDTPRNMLPAADRTLEYPDDVIVDQNGTDPTSNDGGYRHHERLTAPRVGGGKDEEGEEGSVNSRRDRPIGNRVLDLERLMDMPKLV